MADGLSNSGIEQMLYALVARYLGHNVAGNPNVAVLNMQGAGSVVAAN